MAKNTDDEELEVGLDVVEMAFVLTEHILTHASAAMLAGDVIKQA